MATATSNPEPSALASQFAELRKQFRACSAAAKEMMESLSEAELRQSPKKQGWSVAECIQHLTATNQLYLPILDASFEQAPAGGGPYKMDWRGRLLKWVLEPPYRSKAKTMPSLEPTIEDVSRVLPDFLASQQQFLEAMERWNGRALDKVMVTSAFNKRLRYNIFSLFNVVAAHERRHLWQAQRVKDQIRGQ